MGSRIWRSRRRTRRDGTAAFSTSSDESSYIRPFFDNANLNQLETWICRIRQLKTRHRADYTQNHHKLKRVPRALALLYQEMQHTIEPDSVQSLDSPFRPMPRSIAEIAADFDALTARDFEYAYPSARGWERLGELCDEMLIVNDPAACGPVIFRTMERLDGVQIGTPGSLVHTLESWPGHYEKLLAQSVRRKPTPTSVWMINRILNANPPDAASWMALLQSVSDNLAASAATKAEAERFIKFQTKARSNG